eukprot:GDKJ01042118.1.p1 GENE.GDKJ01042118.1~~GDKJ01042118.1.p1  ORF type:complete len:949 (+),score=149.69 GDKJ01042118.1:119-2965(+)
MVIKGVIFDFGRTLIIPNSNGPQFVAPNVISCAESVDLCTTCINWARIDAAGEIPDQLIVDSDKDALRLENLLKLLKKSEYSCLQNIETEILRSEYFSVAEEHRERKKGSRLMQPISSIEVSSKTETNLPSKNTEQSENSSSFEIRIIETFHRLYKKGLLSLDSIKNDFESNEFQKYLSELSNQVLEESSVKSHILVEGAVEVLGCLKQQGIKLALCTNSNEISKQMAIINSFGLAIFFDKIVISGGVGLRKPHPGVMQSVLEAWSMQGNEVLAVGDQILKDVVCANACGIGGVWMGSYSDIERGEKGLRWMKANHTSIDNRIGSLFDLPGLINILNGNLDLRGISFFPSSSTPDFSKPSILHVGTLFTNHKHAILSRHRVLCSHLATETQSETVFITPLFSNMNINLQLSTLSHQPHMILGKHLSVNVIRSMTEVEVASRDNREEQLYSSDQTLPHGETFDAEDETVDLDAEVPKRRENSKDAELANNSSATKEDLELPSSKVINSRCERHSTVSDAVIFISNFISPSVLPPGIQQSITAQMVLSSRLSIHQIVQDTIRKLKLKYQTENNMRSVSFNDDTLARVNIKFSQPRRLPPISLYQALQEDESLLRDRIFSQVEQTFGSWLNQKGEDRILIVKSIIAFGREGCHQLIILQGINSLIRGIREMAQIVNSSLIEGDRVDLLNQGAVLVEEYLDGGTDSVSSVPQLDTLCTQQEQAFSKSYDESSAFKFTTSTLCKVFITPRSSTCPSRSKNHNPQPLSSPLLRRNEKAHKCHQSQPISISNTWNGATDDGKWVVDLSFRRGLPKNISLVMDNEKMFRFHAHEYLSNFAEFVRSSSVTQDDNGNSEVDAMGCCSCTSMTDLNELLRNENFSQSIKRLVACLMKHPMLENCLPVFGLDLILPDVLLSGNEIDISIIDFNFFPNLFGLHHPTYVIPGVFEWFCKKKF